MRNLVTFALELDLLIMVKKVKEVIDLLEENGWVFARMKGDHRIFKKAGQRSIVVPGTLNHDLPEGTYNSILRQAGLK